MYCNIYLCLNTRSILPFNDKITYEIGKGGGELKLINRLNTISRTKESLTKAQNNKCCRLDLIKPVHGFKTFNN